MSELLIMAVGFRPCGSQVDKTASLNPDLLLEAEFVQSAQNNQEKKH